jgi:chromosome segregation ATPase
VLANKSLTKEKNTVATLNSNLQNKTDELTTLQYNLNQTEEGKKQVEAAKAQSDANTNTAQQQANSATAALSTAKSQLSSAQASLNSTNTQLSSAKACVALFNSVNFQITNYDTDMQNAINNLLNSLGAETAGNPSSAANYLQISQSYFNTAEGIFPQIKNVLNRVNSGICN